MCHSPRGKGLTKKMTYCDSEGRGYEPKRDVTLSKKYYFNNRIRKPLRLVITPLHLIFDVDFLVDNKI